MKPPKKILHKRPYHRVNMEKSFKAGFEHGRKQTLEEVIRYINQQKVNYGNKNIFNNQIKFIKALDK